MYTVKRFKPEEIFYSETGAEYGYGSFTTCYGIVNENGKVIVRKTMYMGMKTHFYSRKKEAQAVCDLFNWAVK